MSKAPTNWSRVMKAALAIPGVSVDRDDYLRRTLKDVCPAEDIDRAVAERPAVCLTRKEVDALANSAIAYHTGAVTTLSALTGLPGGPVVLASIPADLSQYYYHVFVLAQKLSYLYGFPDLREEDGSIGDDAADMLTLLCGVMMGAKVADDVLGDVAKDLAVQIAKKMPQKVLMRTVYYPIVKQIAGRIGLSVSKSSFSKTFGRLVPILGGVVSGSVTYASFHKGAKRLQRALHRQMNTLDTLGDEALELTAQENEQMEALALKALVNMALMDDMNKEKKRKYLEDRLEHSRLAEDEKFAYLEAFDNGTALKADFAEFKDDPVNSMLLLRQLAEVVKIGDDVSITGKIYLNKIARELGYTSADVDALINNGE